MRIGPINKANFDPKLSPSDSLAIFTAVRVPPVASAAGCRWLLISPVFFFLLVKAQNCSLCVDQITNWFKVLPSDNTLLQSECRDLIFLVQVSTQRCEKSPFLVGKNPHNCPSEALLLRLNVTIIGTGKKRTLFL